MDVKIGVLHTPREITLESGQSAEEVEQAVAAALASGTLLRLVDSKGNVLLVPSQTIGFVEIGAQPKGTVGFGLQ